MGDPAIDGAAPGTGTPRWVKVFGTIAIVVLVLFVVLHLTGDAPRFHLGH
jgi:hypothetical protein